VAENIRMGGAVSTRERRFERLERSQRPAQFHSLLLARAAPSLMAKDLEISSLSGSGLVQAALQGADTVISSALINGFIYKVFGAPGISSPAQLKGKNQVVGRYELPGTGHVLNHDIGTSRQVPKWRASMRL
jgi:hypothetical protein